jgi:hypothetical protein
MESKLNWGDRNQWTNYHFTKLSDEIFQQTNVRLSVSSIRRLLGQDKSYKDKFNPQIETKNALAKFLGFNNWYEFKDNYKGKKGFSFLVTNKNTIKKAIYAISLILILSGLSFLGYQLFYPEHIFFSGKSLSGNKPHTAVFLYDITKLKNKNEVTIDFGEQYNPSGSKYNLPPSENIITHTYLNSYFYRVKLLYNKKVIQKENVIVYSKNWESGVIIDDTDFFEVPRNLLYHDSSLFLTPEAIINMGIDTRKKIKVEYKNIQDFPFTGDDFEMDFDFQLIDNISNNICDFFKLIILGVDNKIVLRLASTGCASAVEFIVSEVEKLGKYNELDNFAQNIYEKNHLKLVMKNNFAKIYFNHKEIYEIEYKNLIGDIKCIHFVISGTGLIDNLSVKKDNQTLFFDEFNNPN